MKQSRDRLSNEFTNLYKGAHIVVSDAPIRRMVDIERKASEDLTDEGAALVKKQVDKILRKAEDGSLTGEQYQALRTSLADAADGTNTGRYIKMLRSELDGVAKIALGPDKAARLAKVQGQWANLRTTEAALKQVAGAAGNIKPASLYPLVRNGSTKEMRALAKIGQNVLKDPIPDSGTPARLLTMMGLGAGAGYTGGAGAMTALAKPLAIAATAGRAMNSNTLSRLLEQGRPANGLARLVAPTPRVLPVIATPSVSAAIAPRKRKSQANQ